MIYFNLIAVKQKITLSRLGSAENQERQTSKVICEKLNALFMYILSSTADESSANYQAHFPENGSQRILLQISAN